MGGAAGGPTAAAPGAVAAAAAPAAAPAAPPGLEPPGPEMEGASRGAPHRLVVGADAVARLVPRQTAVGARGAAAPSPPGPGAAASREAPAGCCAHGGSICQACRQLPGPEEFVPAYHVCINPLCRRKWKQLTPKVLPLFCPSCKRQLEDSVPGQQHPTEATLTERMYKRWHAIWMELADLLGYTGSVPTSQISVIVHHADVGLGGGLGSTCLLPDSNQGERSSPLIAVHKSENCQTCLGDLLAAFRDSFPTPPRAEDVRNWNSVHARRKHYRGVIHRSHRYFACTVEAKEEIEEDLVTARRVPQGQREFPLLDWHQQFTDGQEVHFVAFPNPAVAERGSVSRIARLLDAATAGAAAPASPGGAAAAAEAGAAGGAAGAAPAGPCAAFEDLVRWSREAPEPEPAAAPAPAGAPAAAAAAAAPGAAPRPRARLSLEAALRPGAPPPAGAARPRRARGAGHRRGPPRAPGAAPPAPRGPGRPARAPEAAAGPRPQGPQRSPSFKSPFPGKGRSPVVCPRSPFAAYFDD